MNAQKNFSGSWLAGVALLCSVLACSLPPYTTSVPTVMSPRAVYVTVTGRDTAACGPMATPCLTVTQGVQRAVAGSTIYIGAGTFLESSVLRLSIPLTFIGAGRGRTTLSSRGTGVFEIAPAVDVHVQNLGLANIAGATSSAVLVGGGNASVEMLHVNVQNNAGIGLKILHGSLATVDDVLFVGNQTGIENAGGVQVQGSIFRSNRLNAIATWGVAAVRGSTLELNGTAGAGSASAAIANYKNSTQQAGLLDITQSQITNNTGSGVTNGGGRVSITNSSVIANAWGVANPSGVMTIVSSLIADNRSSGLSVGVPELTTSSVVQLSRVAIIRNGQNGILLVKGELRGENVTVSGHSASGIRIYAGNLTLAYSTVARNNGTGIGFASSSGGFASLSDTLVNLNSVQECSDRSRIHITGILIACDGSFNDRLRLGPLTPDAATFVIPLQAGSLAIDTGMAGPCPAVDQRGYGRPATRCDMGAYEFGAGMHLVAGTPQIIELLPSATPTVSVTPTSQPKPQLTFKQNANCRKGPGTGYDIVTSFGQGNQAPAEGRNDPASWVYLSIPGTSAHCWVSVSTVEPNVPLAALPVLPIPLLPEAPATFSDKAVCDIKAKSLSVRLSWTGVPNASGYHIYRNGSLLETPGAGVTVYIDGSAPLGRDLLYEIEAFNENGASERLQTTVAACK